MPYRTNAITEFRARMSAHRVGLLQVFTTAILVSTLSIVWSYTRIRAQPVERVVREVVLIPGPIVRVEVPVPALPPPRCLETATVIFLRSLAQILCRDGRIVHAVMQGPDSDFAIVECHCPRTEPRR